MNGLVRKRSLLLVFGLVAGVYGANWVEDGGFESDRPLLWRGASLEHQNVHSGKGAVRIDRDEGKADVTARYSRPVELNQKEPEAIMASFWMRFDSPKRTGKPRGGMTFLMELEDGTSLAWYGPFELRSSEMGSWVYREHRWMPKAPVKRIRPAVYLQGCSGSICVDDLYLGPCQELAAPPRSTIPMAVSAKNGRCSDWGQVEFRSLRPNAHVFQLEGGDRSNLELTSEIEVKRSAPVYLTSSWGSQYWTLYSPPRRELVQIYTDERIELSNPGPQTWALRMSGFSNGASKLAASGYVFLTECTKNFLLYPTKGGTSKDWDIAENDLLSRFLGPNGTAAAFSLADLRSYRIAVAAWRGGGTLKIRPTLTDARGQVVPLYALELRAAGDGRSVTLRPEIAFDGVPTGYYLGELRETAARVKVTGTARLSTPSGIKEESIDVDVSPASDEPTSLPVAAKPLPLLGWSVPSYEFSTKISHCAPSLQREVADAKAAGLTKLLIHARTSSETLFRSRFAAPATLTECDVLEAAVAAGKKESVPIYAAYLLGTAQPEDLKAHPDWAMIGRDGEPQDWYC